MEPQGDKKIPDFFANRTQIQPDSQEDINLEEKENIQLVDDGNFDEVPYDFRAEYKERIERSFDVDEEDEKRFSSIRFHAIGIGLLIGVLVALLASVILFGSNEEELSEPVVISESQRPIKVRPTNPGGMEIPDQDKTIYKRMRSDDADTKVERLVVVEDIPVRPQIPTKEGQILGTPRAIPETSQEMELEVLSVSQKAVQLPAPKSVEVKKTEKIEEKQPITHIKEKPQIKADIKEAQKLEAMRQNEWHVQLISLPSKSGAQKAWPKILKAHSSILSGLPHDIIEVQIKEKGTFYRLRVGSFKDKKDAQNLCSKLKSRKQDCTLIK